MTGLAFIISKAIKMKLLILIAMCASCGQIEQSDHIKNIEPSPFTYKLEPEFVPYYEKFSQTYKVDVKYIAGWFGDTKAQSKGWAVGICFSSDNKATNHIEINKEYWDNSSDNGKEQLIYHELQHCYNNKLHDSTMLDIQGYGKIPASIMYPVAFGEQWFYETFKEYYFKELK